MEEEIKLLFYQAYLPIAHINERYNGGDFLSVAVPIVDQLRNQISDETLIRKACKIMVLEFNSLLDGSIPVRQIEIMIDTICNPTQVIRAIAASIAEENVLRQENYFSNGQ